MRMDRCRRCRIFLSVVAIAIFALFVPSSVVALAVPKRVVKKAAAVTSGKDGKIGLALCGGIFVATAGGAATMRGFQQQSIVVDGEERPAMEAFDYVSGMSGGIIPGLLYSYAQNVDTSQLLDADFRIDDPSQITREALNRNNRKSIFDSVVDSFVFTAVPALLFGLFTARLDAFWTLACWLGTLQPFGIQRNKFFLPNSYDGPSSIIEASIAPRAGVKAIPLAEYLQVGEVSDAGRERIDAYFKVIENLNSKGLVNKFVPQEQMIDAIREVVDDLTTLTPYVADPTDVTSSFISSDGKTFEINSIPTQEWGGLGDHFSLELLMAMGTNFIGMRVVNEDEGSLVSKATLAASQRRTVAVGDGGEKRELLFTDVGVIEGLSVPALVQRKVGTIVASIWPHRKERRYAVLYEKTKGKSLTEWLCEAETLGLGDIASYFGFYQDEEDGKGLFMNQMFKGGEKRLTKLRKTLDALYESGQPLVATMKGLKTIDNPFWGIEAGEIVDLTVILYTLPRDFAEKVPRETVPPDPPNGDMLDSEGSFTNEEFRDFPNLDGMFNFETRTRTWSLLRAGSLSRRQANMAAYLGSWIINEAWEGLTVNGKKVFGGFKEILEK